MSRTDSRRLAAALAFALLATACSREATHTVVLDPVVLQNAMNQAMPAVMTGMLLLIPLIMATWFAPALILFGNARPGQALLISLRAVARNILPIIVNGLALGMVLFVAALIPFMLGLLVAMPVLFGSLYAAYQAIFAVWAEEVTEPVDPAGLVD